MIDIPINNQRPNFAIKKIIINDELCNYTLCMWLDDLPAANIWKKRQVMFLYCVCVCAYVCEQMYMNRKRFRWIPQVVQRKIRRRAPPRVSCSRRCSSSRPCLHYTRIHNQHCRWETLTANAFTLGTNIYKYIYIKHRHTAPGPPSVV